MEVDGTQAEELKNKGNELFKRARPAAACACSMATSFDSPPDRR